MLRIAAAMLLLASGPALAQEAGHRLDLACSGQGTANKDDDETVHSHDSKGRDRTTIISRSKTIDFSDSLQLWIEGSAGKIRVPRILYPGLAGGSGGWFDIRDVRVGQSEITGSVAMNAFNRPKLVVDRLAGTVNLSGKTGTFSGNCHKIDPATAKRAF